MKRLLRYGIPVLTLATVCPTFYLVLGVTLAALIIGAQLVRVALIKIQLAKENRGS